MIFSCPPLPLELWKNSACVNPQFSIGLGMRVGPVINEGCHMMYKILRPVGHWTAVALAAFATMACAAKPIGTDAPKAQPPIMDYPPPPAYQLDDNEQCPAAQLQNLVGKPKSAFNTLRLTGPIRFERPGQIVSMDYRLDRTRVSLNSKGIITAIRCG